MARCVRCRWQGSWGRAARGPLVGLCALLGASPAHAEPAAQPPEPVSAPAAATDDAPAPASPVPTPAGDAEARGEHSASLASPRPADPAEPAGGGAPAGYWERVTEALEARASGQLEHALVTMRRAHALWPSARSLRALGVLASDLERHADAVRYLDAALATRVRALDPALAQVTRELLARERLEVAQITVVATPATARVALDGRASAYATVFTQPGQHTLWVSAPGYAPAERLLHAEPAQRLTLELALQPRGGAAAADGAPPSRRARRAWLTGTAVALAAGALTLALLVARPAPALDRGNTDLVVGKQ